MSVIALSDLNLADLTAEKVRPRIARAEQGIGHVATGGLAHRLVLLGAECARIGGSPRHPVLIAGMNVQIGFVLDRATAKTRLLAASG